MSLLVQSGDNSNWSAEFNSYGPGDMCFKLDNKKLLEVNGVELGILKEKHGIEKICRSHFSDKTGWQWVETETLNPFGSEPVIKRKWEQAGNHIKVVTDILIRATTPMERMSVDSLLLPGKWEKVIVYSQKNSESSEIDITEHDLSDFTGKEIIFNHMPLIMVFSAEDGVLLEVGGGYDLWRWHQTADNLNAKKSFTLSGSQEGIIFNRNVAVWGADFDVERNNFRFSWYFSWSERGEKHKDGFVSCSRLIPEGKRLIVKNYSESENVFCLDSENWPISALVEGIKENMPCFCSRQTGNLLKSWFRSLYSKIEYNGLENIYLTGIDVHICTNSSHMLRGKKDKLVHWDYFYLLNFWEWANKYLGEVNTKFSIVFDRKSIYAELPSVKGLNE